MRTSSGQLASHNCMKGYIYIRLITRAVVCTFIYPYDSACNLVNEIHYNCSPLKGRIVRNRTSCNIYAVQQDTQSDF